MHKYQPRISVTKNSIICFSKICWRKFPKSIAENLFSSGRRNPFTSLVSEREREMEREKKYSLREKERDGEREREREREREFSCPLCFFVILCFFCKLWLARFRDWSPFCGWWCCCCCWFWGTHWNFVVCSDPGFCCFCTCCCNDSFKHCCGCCCCSYNYKSHKVISHNNNINSNSPSVSIYFWFSFSMMKT